MLSGCDCLVMLLLGVLLPLPGVVAEALCCCCCRRLISWVVAVCVLQMLCCVIAACVLLLLCVELLPLSGVVMGELCCCCPCVVAAVLCSCVGLVFLLLEGAIAVSGAIATAAGGWVELLLHVCCRCCVEMLPLSGVVAGAV